MQNKFIELCPCYSDDAKSGKGKRITKPSKPRADLHIKKPVPRRHTENQRKRAWVGCKDLTRNGESINLRAIMGNPLHNYDEDCGCVDCQEIRDNKRIMSNSVQKKP